MEQQNLFTKIKNHKIWCIVVILALLGGGGFGIYKFFFQKKQPQKTVQTQQATTGTIEKTVEGSGSVTATTQNVTFSSDVTVQSVLKKDGATVKKGDVIAKLTSSDLEDSIKQLESQIETLEDTIEDSDSSDDDYASNVRKYKDLTMKLKTLKAERSNLTVTSKYNGIVSGTITKGKTIGKGQSVCKVLKTSSYKVTIVTDDNENGTQTKVKTGIINDTYAQITSGVSEGDQVKVITRSSSSSDDKSDMKGGMDAPSGGGMQGGNKQSGGGMPSGGRQ